MRRIALTAIASLERADLADAAQVVYDRVFSHRTDALVEPYEDQEVWYWRFKPMAELLLIELTELANATDLSAEERRERIDWAIEMAGF